MIRWNGKFPLEKGIRYHKNQYEAIAKAWNNSAGIGATVYVPIEAYNGMYYRDVVVRAATVRSTGFGCDCYLQGSGTVDISQAHSDSTLSEELPNVWIILADKSAAQQFVSSAKDIGGPSGFKDAYQRGMIALETNGSLIHLARPKIQKLTAANTIAYAQYILRAILNTSAMNVTSFEAWAPIALGIRTWQELDSFIREYFVELGIELNLELKWVEDCGMGNYWQIFLTNEELAPLGIQLAISSELPIAALYTNHFSHDLFEFTKMGMVTQSLAKHGRRLISILLASGFSVNEPVLCNRLSLKAQEMMRFGQNSLRYQPDPAEKDYIHIYDLFFNIYE